MGWKVPNVHMDVGFFNLQNIWVATDSLKTIAKISLICELLCSTFDRDQETDLICFTFYIERNVYINFYKST